jgi:hypothetical protein
MRKGFTYVVLGLVGASVFLINPDAKSIKQDAVPNENFDRAQTLIVNLNRVQGSSGWYMLEGLKCCKTMDHDLLKALRQVEEVDKTFGKLRGRPDTKHLDTTAVKIEKAIQSNQQLTSDLLDSYDELKAQIKDTLVTDPKLKL